MASRSRRSSDYRFSPAGCALLAAVVAALAMLVAVGALFGLSYASLGISEPLAEFRCSVASLCPVPPGEVPPSRVAFVSAADLVACQRDGLDGCSDYRTTDVTAVPVFLSDGYVLREALMPPLAGRSAPLRYVAIVDDPGDTTGYHALYCVYATAWSDDPLSVEPGDPLVVTAELRWRDGDLVFSTVRPDGSPGCRVWLVRGQPLR